MASTRCVIRHTGSPIDSLYRIFGIPNSARCAPQRTVASSRSISSAGCRLPQRASTQRKSLALQSPSLRASLPPRTAHQRYFSSTSPTYKYKTVEEARSRGRLGVLNISPLQALIRGAFIAAVLTVFIQPLTLKAGLVFVITGAGIVIYFREERARLERKRIAEQTKGIGRPKVGGPFDLVDHNGNRFTHQDLKGKYSLVCL